MTAAADDRADDCFGCGCADHIHRVDDVGECYEYCTSCAVKLSADHAVAKAEWLLWRLKVIADVNPLLLIDVIDGTTSFEAANRAAIAADPIAPPMPGATR